MKVCVACRGAFESEAWRCPRCGHDPPGNGYRRLSAPLAELEEAYDPAEFRAVAAAEATSFWAQARNEFVAWSLQTYFPDSRSLLEVGCGAGIVLAALQNRFPQLRLVGGDPYGLALELAADRLDRVELLQLDGRDLPFEREFDTVAVLDVLEHVDEDDRVLREIHRALRPSAGLLVAVPQHPRLWSAADEWNLHRRRYRRAELVTKVEQTGFEILRVTSFVSFLLPAMALARLAQRDRARFDPCAEMRLPRPLHAVCGGSLRLELGLVKRGVSLPAGGSLLMVARKRERER
jgi:SAM-dependent methyltransferase